MITPDKEQLRALPSVDEVLLELEPLITDEALHQLAADAVRAEIDAQRTAILAGSGTAASAQETAHRALLRMQGAFEPSLRRVVNATGVIIHTNLGRSALAQEAIDAVVEAARGYSTLEYNVEAMERGSRHVHCERLICELTGAEAAIAVNNNAAAVMMVLSEFARGHEAVISRGQQIEIGGSFRIPDIMDTSGATMVEVGTTNKTHLADYERAVTNETAMFLQVHTSNYRLIGFTETVPTRELRRLADTVNATRAGQGNTGLPPVLVYEDLGSGMLLPLPVEGCDEPTVAQAVTHGCDLVSFSGDKLLGGPQAGIVVGRKELIDRLKKNPLARALRLDKMTLAALEATLRLYLEPDKARAKIPTLNMLSLSADETRERAERLAAELAAKVPAEAASFAVVPETSRAGGGSLPMLDIPTFAVETTVKTGTAQECASWLIQKNTVPIVARMKHEKLLFDVRTLLGEAEQDEVAQAMAAWAQQAK